MTTPIHGLQVQINGQQADPSGIQKGKVKDLVNQLSNQAGFLPNGPHTPVQIDQLSIIDSPPPSDLPPEMIILPDGSQRVKYPDGKVEFIANSRKPVESAQPDPAPLVQTKLALPIQQPMSSILNHAPSLSKPGVDDKSDRNQRQDSAMALQMGIAEELTHNAPKKISDRFQHHGAPLVKDRSHEVLDFDLAIEIQKIELQGYEAQEGDYWLNKNTDDFITKEKLIETAKQNGQKAQISIKPTAVVDPALAEKIAEIENQGYVYQPECDFWLNNKGDGKTKDDLIQLIVQKSQIAQGQRKVDPIQEEVNRLLKKGYQELDKGIYYCADSNQCKVRDDIEKDLIQEVNAAAKAMGYFFDASAGFQGVEAIYAKNSGESISFIDLYEKYVKVNYQT